MSLPRTASIAGTRFLSASHSAAHSASFLHLPIAVLVSATARVCSFPVATVKSGNLFLAIISQDLLFYEIDTRSNCTTAAAYPRVLASLGINPATRLLVAIACKSLS